VAEIASQKFWPGNSRGFEVMNEHDDFTTDATRVERFAPLPPLVYEDRATGASDALTGAWMRAVAAGNHAVADALATLIRRSR
jgi:hypothetical protein